MGKYDLQSTAYFNSGSQFEQSCSTCAPHRPRFFRSINTMAVGRQIVSFCPSSSLVVCVVSVMTSGRASPRSSHVFRGGFKLPKCMKSPLHALQGDDQTAFGVGHTSPLLHKSHSMTGLHQDVHDGERDNPFLWKSYLILRRSDMNTLR